MNNLDWIETCPASITVCDADGMIIAMNEKAHNVFLKDGGRKLIGTNVLDCHPEPSRTKLREMLEKGEANTYTIEKNGIRKLIYQFPWQQNGKFAGLVEFAIEIPWEMPHFVRS